MPTLPGYARPNATQVEGFPIELGQRNGSVIEWTPLGAYKSCEVDWHWFQPGNIQLELKPDHRLIPYMRPRRKAIHVRIGRGADGLIGYNGIPWTGRLMTRNIAGRPGRENCTFGGVDYKFWLQRWLAWVNPQFPPEVQVGLTGKQDVMAGEPDFVLKYFLAKNFIRLNKPVFAKLPLHQVGDDLPDLDDIDTLDDLLNLINTAIENMTIISARFTQGDELYKLTRDRLDFGYSMDLWDGTGTPPHVFNTSSLAQLQSVLDVTSDNFLNFLNPDNYLGLADPASWGVMPRAGYVFDTRKKRDRRKIQWRTDGGQIEHYVADESHADATRVIVGGKAPEILNQVIEWAANFAIQLLLAAIAPGLGLGFVVGDLFDNIFFAYQQFWDDDLEDEIGYDDAFAEVFGDNTAAWSLDSYQVGQGKLKEHSGSEELELTTVAGGPDGRGYRFGADDGSGKRYDVGDIHTFYDRGNVQEQYVSGVRVSDHRDGRMVETPKFGEDKRLRGAFDRLVGNISGLAATTRGIANTT
ncbi:hypothetical protein [Antrihabitans spumae]|uniref:Gp28/Gp37-like domain-containing protein n=1 Tax=Antrihabitans spumae TaxID=3373370 RepID=A0ABW7K9X4_9NOCA